MQAHDCTRCTLSRYRLRPCGCCTDGKHCGDCMFVRAYRALQPRLHCPHLALHVLSWVDWAEALPPRRR